MLESIIINVNWVATLVGAVVAFGVGWLWYSQKMFGTKWAEGIGLVGDHHAMVAQGVGTFLLAWVIGVTETTGAIALAILIALTISVLIKANGFWSQKSKYAIAVESGYILVMVIIMIAAHAFL